MPNSYQTQADELRKLFIEAYEQGYSNGQMRAYSLDDIEDYVSDAIKLANQRALELLDELEKLNDKDLMYAWLPIDEFIQAKRLNLTKGGE